MREEETIQVRPDWFDLGRNIVPVEKIVTFNVKNKKFRAVPLHSDFEKFLERQGKREPFMLKPEVEKGKRRYRYDCRKPFAIS